MKHKQLELKTRDNNLAEICASVAVNHPLSKWGKSYVLDEFEGNILEKDSWRIECIFPVGYTTLVYVTQNGELVYHAQIFDLDDFFIEGDKEIPIKDYCLDVYDYKPGKWEEQVRLMSNF